MKKICFVALVLTPLCVLAQTAANNNSSSSTTTSAQGNNQQVVFANPSTLTSTQNIISSGVSKTIVEYSGSQTVRNVPSINGPNLTTSNDTCMGSSSGSASGPGIGISFGSTWTDEQCKRLKMSRELWNKGMKAASLAMDCMDPAAMAALEMTGTKCPQNMTPAERAAAYGPPVQTSAARPSAGAVAAAAPAVAAAAAEPSVAAPAAPPVATPAATPSPPVITAAVTAPVSPPEFDIPTSALAALDTSRDTGGSP